MLLKNFRQFYKENIIEFAQHKNQNITLVLGDNTSGKTTLLQAFLWVFYGEANFRRKEALLNSKVAEEMLQSNEEENVEIEIELEHQGVEYTIHRKLTYYFDDNGVRPNKTSEVRMTYKDINGETESIVPHKIPNKISEILPKNLSPYFLYDTERFDSVATKSDVANSVKGILGLTVLENIRAHLGTIGRSKSVIGKLYASLNEKGAKEASEAYEILTENTKEKKRLEEKIQNGTEELENYRKLIAEKQNILKDLAASAFSQEQKEKAVLNLESIKEKKYDAENAFQKLFQQDIWQYFGMPLFNRVKDNLEETQLDQKAIRDMNVNAIEDIIERGTCVCGTKIEKGNAAYAYLLEEMQYLPPESIGTLIKYFKKEAVNNYKSGEKSFTGLEATYKSLVSYDNTIGDLEDEIQILNDELIQQDDIGEHQQQLLSYESKILHFEQQLGILNQRLGILTKEIISNEEKYEKNIDVSEKNKEIYRYLAYAEEIVNWSINQYTSREEAIKIQLENKVNEYFQQMYHGSRRLEITDKFEVKLITTDLKIEIQTDESQGLGTVKNFAFIAGLVDLAKEKLVNSIEKDAEEYPLILDAPFSNADEKHVENISNILPKVANQLILIVMAKDWNYAKKSLSSKIGKEYLLDKQTEVHTLIKEVR